MYRARAEGGGLRRFEVRLVRGASLGADTPAEVARELKRVEALGLASVPRVIAVEADPAGLLVVTEGLDAGGTWESLREVLTAGDRLVAPVLDKLLEAMVQVLDGLHRADPAVLHRALCPENISLVERRSAVRIEESGLAHALAASGAVSGRVLAAPKAYVSPDELLQRPGPRADLFAMASVVYEVLTLRPAFRAVSEAATETAILRGPRPSVLSARPDLSYEVDDVLLRAWSTDIHGGFATAAEMVTALRGALAAPAGPRPSTTPPARTSLAPAAGRSSTPPPPPPAALKSLTQTLKTGSESPLRAASNTASSAARTGLGSTQKVTVPRINAPGTERLDPASAEVNPLRANTMLGVPPPRPTQPVVARAEAPPGTTARAPGLRPAPPVAPPPPGDAAPAAARDSWDEVNKPAVVPVLETVVEPAEPAGSVAAPSVDEAPAAPAAPAPAVSAPVVEAEPAAATAPAPASEDLEADDDLVPASGDLPTMELGEADELPEGVPVPAADLQVVEMTPEPEAPLVTVEVPVPFAPRAPSVPPPMPHPPRASTPEVAPPLAVAEEPPAPPPALVRAMPAVASVPVGLPPPVPAAPSPVADPVVVRVARILGVAVVLAAVVVTAGQIYLSQRPAQPVAAQPVAAQPAPRAAAAQPATAQPATAQPAAALPSVDAGLLVVQAVADAAVASTEDAAVAAAAPVVDAGHGPVEPAPSAPSAPVAAADASAPMRGHPRVREEDQYLVRVEPAVLRCVAQSGHRRRCRATLTFEGATGAVSEVRLTGVYSDPPTGPCIEQALRSATMPPFTDARWTTTFIFDPVERR